MYELIWTVCLSLSGCENKPIERNLMLDECIEKIWLIDAKQGALNCVEQPKEYWLPVTLTHEEIKDETKYEKN